MKRYYKCKKGAMIGGVCMGISQYYNIDPTITRLATILLTIATDGFLILVYIILCVCLPYKELMSNNNEYEKERSKENAGYNTGNKANMNYDINSERVYYTDLNNDTNEDITNKNKSKKFIGALFIACGVILMVNRYVPSFIKAYILPGSCLILGIIILLSGFTLSRKNNKNQEETYYQTNTDTSYDYNEYEKSDTSPKDEKTEEENGESTNEDNNTTDKQKEEEKNGQES